MTEARSFEGAQLDETTDSGKASAGKHAAQGGVSPPASEPVAENIAAGAPTPDDPDRTGDPSGEETEPPGQDTETRPSEPGQAGEETDPAQSTPAQAAGAAAGASGQAPETASGQADGVQTELAVAEAEPSPRLLSILESLLFAADKPLKISALRKLLGERSTAKVKRAVRALQAARIHSGIQVVEVDGGFQLRTNPDNAQWVRRLDEVKPVRISRAALEVLSVVAYRQPVTRAEIDQIRGVDSGAVLKQLLTRDLLRIVGRKDEPGRPFLYGTTHEFLSFFGLASLSELPSLRDVSELAREQVEATQVPPADAPLLSEANGAQAEQGAEQTPEDVPRRDGDEDSGRQNGAQDEDSDLLSGEDEVDEGDDELLEAITEVTDAARGAERIKRRLRKMASEQAEGLSPDSEAGKMFSSLADVVAARKRRKAQAPTEAPPENDAQHDDEGGPGDRADHAPDRTIGRPQAGDAASTPPSSERAPAQGGRSEDA